MKKMDKLHKREKDKKERYQENPIESVEDDSTLQLEESEDELFKFQEELQEEILREAERDIPDLEDDEEVLNGVMAQVFKNLNKVNPPNLELPPKKIEEKIEEVLNEDLENCALLIDRLSTHIQKQTEYKKLVDQRRKTVHNIVQKIEMPKAQNSEDDLRNILKKVNKTFHFLRNKLSDLIEEWGGDDSSEIIQIFSALTQANLEETGPAAEGKYVEVENFRRDVIQFVVSNKLAVWDKDEALIKLAV